MEGLLHECKSNIEKMLERVPDISYEQLQYFISESPWDAFAVMDQVSIEASCHIDRVGLPVGYIFDESGWEKSGKKSVGVSRQYIGNVGKVCNAQLGVFGALCSGDKVALAQGRLFVPQEWIKDKKRCKKAGIPEEKRVYKTKGQLCVEMLDCLPESVNFDWVGGDSIYGNSPDLRHYLLDNEIPFVLDIGGEMGLYLEHPEPFIPKQGKGRKPTKYRTTQKTIQVKDLIKQLPKEGWQLLTHREGTKGPKTRKVYWMPVYLWSSAYGAKVEQYKLLFSTEANGTEMKYSLCYQANENLELKTLLYYQMARYWVERAFQNIKQQLGMHQYQVRSWKAWYHHIVLSMMALDFILGEQLDYMEEMPLISCADVKLIFAHSLMNQLKTQEGLEKAIRKRHHARLKDILAFKT